jgi:hypothetical protein
MEAEKQSQHLCRKGQNRKLEDVVAATVTAAAAVASSLGGTGTDDVNKHDRSVGPQICCRRSNTALPREVCT